MQNIFSLLWSSSKQKHSWKKPEQNIKGSMFFSCSYSDQSSLLLLTPLQIKVVWPDQVIDKPSLEALWLHS